MLISIYIPQYLKLSWVSGRLQRVISGLAKCKVASQPRIWSRKKHESVFKKPFWRAAEIKYIWNKKIWLCHLVQPKYVYSSSVFSSHICFSSELHFWLIMTSLLTGSVAFAGFVIAAETYRSYKEKVKTRNIRNWIFLQGLKLRWHKLQWALKRHQIE